MASSSSSSSSSHLTEKEAEIYDRQIRLWGVDAQRRMRSSRVLVCGMGALGAEVAKNIALAGVNVTLQDEHIVREEDRCAQFFLAPSAVGCNRALASLAGVRELNPLVECTAESLPLHALADEHLRAFRLVAMCDVPPAVAVRARKCPGVAAGRSSLVAACSRWW